MVSVAPVPVMLDAVSVGAVNAAAVASSTEHALSAYALYVYDAPERQAADGPGWSR